MLDLKFVVENAQKVKDAMATRSGSYDVDEVLRLDSKRRELLKEVESLKAQRNKVSGEIAVMKKNKQNADDKIAEMKKVGETIKALDAELAEVEPQLRYALLSIPNIPDASILSAKTIATT